MKYYDFYEGGNFIYSLFLDLGLKKINSKANLLQLVKNIANSQNCFLTNKENIYVLNELLQGNVHSICKLLKFYQNKKLIYTFADYITCNDIQIQNLLAIDFANDFIPLIMKTLLEEKKMLNQIDEFRGWNDN